MWELFDQIAEAVHRAVAAADRVGRGDRPGQYRLDLVADAVVIPRLLDAGLGVMSEESGRHGADREVCVVVDPVDGSTNASRGLPCWSTSLCAVDADGPLLAVVADVSRGVTYRAARGEGATRNHEPISVAEPVAVGDAVVALNGWSPTRPPTWQYRALGAASIEICLVADGSLDGYLNLDVDAHGPWDYLGALLVLTEAGGVAADVSGRDLISLDHDARRTVACASGPGLLAAMMGP